MLCRPARRYRKSCRYWNDSMTKRPALRGESGSATVHHAPDRPGEISARRRVRGGCLPPYTPHPCLRLQAFRGCDSGKPWNQCENLRRPWGVDGRFSAPNNQQKARMGFLAKLEFASGDTAEGLLL